MTTASVTDLRSYLTVLEQAGELSRVSVPVSLEQEIGAICLRNLRTGGPGLLFERPGDRAMPLAVDLLASRRRYALAIGIEPDQLAAEWNRRTRQPLQVQRYLQRISGSLLDRIDIHIEVPRLQHEDLLGRSQGEPSTTISRFIAS